VNDNAKVTRDGNRDVITLPEGVRAPGEELRVEVGKDKLVLERVQADMGWVDRLEALDEDAAAAALERPDAGSYERDDLDLD